MCSGATCLQPSQHNVSFSPCQALFLFSFLFAKSEIQKVGLTEISRRKVVTLYMFCVKKSFNGNMYGSLAPKRTLFARFWMIFAISSSPRRISLVGCLLTRPSTSGATMAGQKKRRKTKAPTAVYLESWNLAVTVLEIFQEQTPVVSYHNRARANREGCALLFHSGTATHNTANLPE